MTKRTKKTLAVSGKVLLRLILASVLCAILYFSMLTIATGLFSDVVGYQVYDTTTDQSQNFYFSDGALAEDKPTSTETVVVTDLRKVSDETLSTFNVISQIMMLIVLAIFPDHILWEFGNRDDTKVRYKGQKPDALRGVKVGALACVPYFLLWVCLLLVKFGVLPNTLVLAYRLVHVPFMPFVNAITSNGLIAETPAAKLLLLLLPLCFIVAVCGIAYRLGYKQFSVRERLVFAKSVSDAENE